MNIQTYWLRNAKVDFEMNEFLVIYFSIEKNKFVKVNIFGIKN